MRLLAVLFALLAGVPAAALPPVPVPAENPLTEEKRILGKILFWDEQLSSDNSIACGSCHMPFVGGADPRPAGHPGVDGVLGTQDDTMGSPGIVHLGPDGDRASHPVFRSANQTTDRTAPSNFGGLWAEQLFWDGRAGPAFIDPLTDETLIADGGALEAQALQPLMDASEMAQEQRTWPDLTEKLAQATPLALADRIPPDMAAALAPDDGSAPSYPDLFAAAFGDRDITPARIAFALAAYQRTLVADRTPWDLAQAGGPSLSAEQQRGFAVFTEHGCGGCHAPPLFTTNGFASIGLRPAEYDEGRRAVTGLEADAGAMKIPSLRNVGLRAFFTHAGTYGSVQDVLAAHAPQAVADPQDERALAAFLAQALTDPRAEAQELPFDRPRLRSAQHPVDFTPPAPPTELTVEAADGGVRLTWLAASDDTGVVDYVIRRNGAVVGYATQTSFVDAGGSAGATYAVTARDAPLNESEAAVGR